MVVPSSPTEKAPAAVNGPAARRALEERMIESSRAMYAKFKHSDVYDISVPIERAEKPGATGLSEGAPLRHVSRRVAALEGQLSQLNRQELLELRDHTGALLAERLGVAPSRHLTSALILIERLGDALAQADACTTQRPRLVAFTEMVEALQGLIGLLPHFGLADADQLVWRVLGGAYARLGVLQLWPDGLACRDVSFTLSLKPCVREMQGLHGVLGLQRMLRCAGCSLRPATHHRRRPRPRDHRSAFEAQRRHRGAGVETYDGPNVGWAELARRFYCRVKRLSGATKGATSPRG